jgi:hypothetical protein
VRLCVIKNVVARYGGVATERAVFIRNSHVAALPEFFVTTHSTVIEKLKKDHVAYAASFSVVKLQ